MKDKKTMFEEMAEGLAKNYRPQERQEPVLKASIVRMVAGKMASAGYEFTPKAIEALTCYLKGYNVCLFGSVGVGKTYFFECMSRVRTGEKGLPPIVKLSMIETMGWSVDTAREWCEYHLEDDVLLDDVGSEPIMNSYGVKAELFPYLLEKRMQVSRKRTHMTSNLGAKDILSRYDARVSDRFVQMFKAIRIDSKKSRRETRPWKTPAKGGGLL